MNVRFNAPVEMPSEFPEEMPDLKEEKLWEGVEFRVNKDYREVPERNSVDGGSPDIMFNAGKLPDITVSLSWKRNLKLVTNWMRKHMEAYPETVNGFFVRFIDDESEWYLVLPCDDNEKWEKINWVNYKILPYIFESDFEKVNGVTGITKREMLKIFEWKKISGNNEWDVDKNERRNRNNE